MKLEPVTVRLDAGTLEPERCESGTPESERYDLEAYDLEVYKTGAYDLAVHDPGAHDSGRHESGTLAPVKAGASLTQVTLRLRRSASEAGAESDTA